MTKLAVFAQSEALSGGAVFRKTQLWVQGVEPVWSREGSPPGAPCHTARLQAAGSGQTSGMNLRHLLSLAAVLVLALAQVPTASAQKADGKFVPAPPDLQKSLAGLQKPFYPAALARGARPEGTAVLRLYFDETGKLAQTKVQKSSGSADLDKAAADFVKGFKFQPFIQNGKAVSWYFDYTAPYKAPAPGQQSNAPKKDRPEY